MKWYEDPVYIKMSEKAVEIQEKKRQDGLVHGDYIYYPKEKEWVIVYDKSKCYKFGLLNDAIWLPRQDDLQGMYYEYLLEKYNGDINKEDIKPVLIASAFGHWSINQEIRRYTSMEQLWLAYVMHEKYGKKWNGGDWVKE